ncbi:hypothetical protein MAR_017439 [Mya arenaria]|uniref:Uncharacterized protein n=1 Tax=Mya arenaria TaxID=6604 RepID=A0ABY7EJU9_MYAAR|nr:hypothetical protein MAR_017439 [Mya arenaria]
MALQDVKDAMYIVYPSEEAAMGMFPNLSRPRRPCCNGILGYANPENRMPCAEMRCCNSEETVALQKVNHALGFCFRCVPQSHFMTSCYTDNQEVASTNETAMEYKMKTCCNGLKFAVVTYKSGVALTIKCVKR